MKKVIFVWLVLLTNIFGQNNIPFEFDYARFKYDSTNTYLEIYYSIGQGELIPYKIDNKFFLGAYLDISIRDTLINNLLVNRRYKSVSEIDTSQMALYKTKNLIGNLGYIIPPGKYLLKISTMDIADTTKITTYKEYISINKFPVNRYSISDIQLASRIITDSKNKNSIFYKNTMEVFPNPHDIYTQTMPVLFFYSELYNVNNRITSESDLILVQQLLDGNGNTLESKQKSVTQNNSSIVEAGVFNLKKYPTGSYIIRLSLFEDSLNVGIASSKRFYLINPSVKQAKQVTYLGNNNVKSSEFGIYSEEECDEMFEVCEPIATSQDKDTYERLNTLDSKREFLFKFWKARDMEPDTPKNEFKEEYMERVAFVEARYKAFNRRGVKTDRGRIYLIYGEPDEVDYYPNDYNTKPYEIWRYNSIEGGVEFVFGDITGYNDYELLHSTKRGELRDDNWRRRITVN